jgi:pyruvate dehydrogenase E1 component alpha subunit
MYTSMVRIRRFEEAAVVQHRRGVIPGPVHISIGQEATVVGACAAVGEDDYLTGNHRSHGHPIAKGSPLNGLMAELMGKATGVCGGRGGSMHLADFTVGSLGESGIVGSAMPVAVGAALSAQVRGTKQVCLCFFGDGAVNTGAFHEAVNLAAIWRLPVIFICENNGYAVTTPITNACAVANVADRGSGYGIPAEAVDGQDVLIVHDAVTRAVARARSGAGPSLIECKTYRYYDHEQPGPVSKRVSEYRSAEEIASWKARDPVVISRSRLLETGQTMEEKLSAREQAVADEVAAALRFALDSPAPNPDSILDDVFAPAGA